MIQTLNSILIFSGPPAAGKSTLAQAWARIHPKSMVIPVDDLRLWVVGGLSEPLPEWTAETDRQFRLAEDSAADVAKRYFQAGFQVALDHCRVPKNIEAWVERCFADTQVTKIAVLPSLSTALQRNLSRTSKNFNPAVLEPVILSVHDVFTKASLESWIVLENEGTLTQSLDELNRAL